MLSDRDRLGVSAADYFIDLIRRRDGMTAAELADNYDVEGCDAAWVSAELNPRVGTDVFMVNGPYGRCYSCDRPVATDAQVAETTGIPSKQVVYGDRERPPVVPPFDPAGIPDELKRQRRWVLWRQEWAEPKDDKPGHWTKVPYQAVAAGGRRRKAKPNTPGTWTTFEKALAAYQRQPDEYAGLGFVTGDGWPGVDLDGVRNPATGEFTPAAADLLAVLGTFTDISASGCGVKAVGRGRWPAGNGQHHPLAGGGDAQVHGWKGRHFYALTGRPAGGLKPPADITAVLAERFTVKKDDRKRTATPPPEPAPTDRRPSAGDTAARAVGVSAFQYGAADKLTDDELVAKACKSSPKFARLWDGELTDFGGDQSRCDLSLCNYLAYWCGGPPGDPARADRLFRRSGLMRPKWDEGRGESTYGRWTVGLAFEGRTEFYTGRPPPG